MTDRYALFGNPIGHSRSPRIHAAFAAQTGEDMSYEAIAAPVDGFADAVTAFAASGGRGCNVTAPFKLEAFALATERDDAAEMAGAANTLILDGAAIRCTNTDGEGLRRDIEHNLGCPIAGRRLLMLGAGGAARGAALPFLMAGPAELVIADRNLSSGEAIRDRLAAQGIIRVTDYDAIDAEFDIVVNATSASLSGELPPVPAAAFAGCALAYDLVYGKGLTPFLALAKSAGVPRLADGVGMLVEQAAIAFAAWRGRMPDTAGMIADLTVPLD